MSVRITQSCSRLLLDLNALKHSPWLAVTTALETAAQDRLEAPAISQLPLLPLPSVLQTWDVERSSAYPATVRIIPGSWTTARRPLENAPEASQAAMKPATMKTPVALLDAMFPDPVRALAIFQLRPSSLVSATQHPVGLWALCRAATGRWVPSSTTASLWAVGLAAATGHSLVYPTAADQWALSLMDAGLQVVWGMALKPFTLCHIASDLCNLSLVVANQWPPSSAPVVHLALHNEVSSILVLGNNSVEEPGLKLQLSGLLLPSAELLFLVCTLWVKLPFTLWLALIFPGYKNLWPHYR